MSGQRVAPFLLLSIAALLAGAGVFYHLVVTVPQRERAKQELVRRWLADHEAFEAGLLQRSDKQLEFARGLLLNGCLEEAAAAKLDDWATTCKLQSLPADCTLPASFSSRLDDAATQRRRDCFTKYPPPR